MTFRTLLLTSFFSIFLFAASSHAKVLEDKSKVDKVSDFFMSQILTGDTLAAYSLISAYLGVDGAPFEEQGKKAALGLTTLNNNLGKPLSYALLEKQSVGEHFYKVIYLLKYESAAVIWEINYYQPSDGWKLVDINYNTNINSLFK